MPGGRLLDPFYAANFTEVQSKENRSKRKIHMCNHCSKELEHRDNRLANHIASSSACSNAPAASRTAAHVLLAGKKSGKKRPADTDDELNSASTPRKDSASEPPKKKAKTQTNLDGVVDHPMTQAREDSANRKLFRFFVHANIAFIQANNIFLANFTNDICPSFHVASRNTMSTLMLDSEHSRVHLELVDVLQSMKRSGTYIIDGWEDELRRSLYGSAAGRVGQPTVIMGLQDLTGHRGSAAKILEASGKAMTEMGIQDASCFLATVTDDPNVMKSFRKGFVKKYPWIIVSLLKTLFQHTLVSSLTVVNILGLGLLGAPKQHSCR